MKKKLLLFLTMMLSMILLLTGCGSDSGNKQAASGGKKLIIYTSMKESLITGIVEGFKKANPGVEVDYQSAGAGKLMAKIAAEKQSGKILADVIWTSEVPDFYNLKKEGMLLQYQSPVLKDVVNPFTDYDGSFTAIRLGTLGIAYNTDKVKTAPAQWSDLTGPDFKNAYGIADPSLSGTSFMSIAILSKQFGWDYFNSLAANGARIGKGSGQVVDDTASGELSGSLAVDYITNDKIAKGAHIKLAYPPELIVVPSPAAIFKSTANPELAKKFLDYLLSKEAQEIIAKSGTLPVRNDVAIPEKFALPTPKEAIERSIKIDYTEILTKKEETIKKFDSILKK